MLPPCQLVLRTSPPWRFNNYPGLCFGGFDGTGAAKIQYPFHIRVLAMFLLCRKRSKRSCRGCVKVAGALLWYHLSAVHSRDIYRRRSAMLPRIETALREDTETIIASPSSDVRTHAYLCMGTIFRSHRIYPPVYRLHDANILCFF